MEQKRFNDRTTYLNQYMNCIDVECPKCRKKAIVHCEDYPKNRKPARIVCTSCGFNETQSKNSWKGPVYGKVRRRCPYCGAWMEKHVSGPRHPYLAELECQGCHTKIEDEIIWYRSGYGKALDPFFGLPLWFVAQVGSEALWAYNRPHLRFIKDYVGATLRYRTPNRNSTLVSRLPTWIKKKGNRATILKVIDELEMKS